jgi:hypothetical protein
MYCKRATTLNGIVKTDQPLDLIEHASKKNLLFSYHEITAGLSLPERNKTSLILLCPAVSLLKVKNRHVKSRQLSRW